MTWDYIRGLLNKDVIHMDLSGPAAPSAKPDASV
jgi:hypothetical protein